MKNKTVLVLFCVLACCLLTATLAACARTTETPPVSFTVTFDSNGGSAVAAQSVQKETTITIPAAPTKEGYTFIGWYFDATTAQKFHETMPIIADITLYAGWEITPCTVTFDSKGGSAVKSLELEPGTIFDWTPWTTKYDYQFTGWYTDDATTRAFEPAAITSDITLYAGWKINRYTVKFYDDRLALYDTVTVDSGDTAAPAVLPTKTGHTFIGWYTALTDGVLVPSTTEIRSDMSLTAVFEINKYTVSCQKNINEAGTVTATQQYDYDSRVTVTATTASLKYVFDGWYLNGEQVSSELSYVFFLKDSDVNLTANWSLRPGLADYTYVATADTLTIKKYNGDATVVSVPEGVTHIGNGAFNYLSSGNNNCMYITSITLPNTVVSIGSSAFASCSALESITLSNALTSIGSSAFDACKKLVSIDIPQGVTKINENTFYNCGKLVNVTLPNTLQSIGTYAFYLCASLTTVEIPSSVTKVSRHAFYMCSNATINCVAAEKPTDWDAVWYYQVGSVNWGSIV